MQYVIRAFVPNQDLAGWWLRNKHLHQITARGGCNLRQGESATFEDQPPGPSRATIVPLGAANLLSGTARLAAVPIHTSTVRPTSMGTNTLAGARRCAYRFVSARKRGVTTLGVLVA